MTEWLDVECNLANTDAEYTKAIGPIPVVGTLSVDTYPDSPKWSGSANVVVKLPVPTNLGTLDLRDDFYGQTHTYFSSTNGTSPHGPRLDASSTIALRYSWKDIMARNVPTALCVRNKT